MRVENDGVGIELCVTGPGTGPVVVLLHGFPDSARLWRHQVPALAAAGLRVVTPDLRGFGRSDKPARVGAYRLPLLVGDVLAVLDGIGAARAHVVGHDWGAVLAWALATAAPERVDRLVALSVGHPASFATAGPAQLRRSWYVLLFQLRGVAERWLRHDDWAALRAWAHHPDVDEVITELERDDSLTPGLSWYRANLCPSSWGGLAVRPPAVQAPTMGVWSAGDFALTEGQMTGSAAHCANGFRYERLDGAGHWLQLDAPDRLNRLLLDFLVTGS